LTPISPATAPRARSRLRRAARPAVLLAVAGALLAATPEVFASTTLGAAPSDTAPCLLASQPPLAVDQHGHAPPAGPVLRRLAERLRPVPADATSGRYAYIAVRMQAADSVFEGPCVHTVTAYATEQRWRADDGSGQVTGVPWHQDPADPPPVGTTTYPAGGLPGVVSGPVPTDPAVLAAALDAAYPPSDAATLNHAQPLRAADTIRQRRLTGTAARLRAVADLTAWHYTNRDARRAVLLVLADVSGLAYRGGVVGYPGAIAVSADSGDWRELLVINPTSGVVLTYEQVLLRNGQQLGVHTPYSNARTLYAARGHATAPGQPPARSAGTSAS
jgi:hypothetical protein